MKSNWFAANRDWLSDDLWLKEPFSRGQARLDLVSMARHKADWIQLTYARIYLERGQLAWSLRGLAKRWKWSPGKVGRFLQELTVAGFIKRESRFVTEQGGCQVVVSESVEELIENQTHLKKCAYSVTTIVCYTTSQPDRHTPGHRDGPTPGHTHDTPDRHIREKGSRKKGKEGREGVLAHFDYLLDTGDFDELSKNGFRELYARWVGHRIEIRKKPTRGSVEADCKSMKKMIRGGAGHTVIEAWMEQGIQNGNQGWFYKDKWESWVEKNRGGSTGQERSIWTPPREGE